MTKSEILSPQLFTTVYLDTHGTYVMDIEADGVDLEVGKDYVVVLDNVEYACTCVDIGQFQEGCVALGNLAPVGLTGNNEPFAVIDRSNDVDKDITVFCFTDTAPTTHIIAIYRVAGGDTETQVGIILRDYKGEETTHYGVERLEVDTTDGGTQMFVLEDLVATPVEATVELDFSGGDMVVTPGKGKTFSNVNIPTPANLIPENIAEGIDIAGIIGTLVAGTGNKIKIAIGKVTYQSSDSTITHGLGVLPDVIFTAVNGTTTGSTISNRRLGSYGVSADCAEKHTDVFGSYRGGDTLYQSGKWYTSIYNTPMDQAVNSAQNSIYNVTDNTFTLRKWHVYGVYIAISGLT